MRRITVNGVTRRERFQQRQYFYAVTWWLVVFALTSEAPVCAHGDLHQRVAALDAQIKAQPNKAELYLVRSELHSTHGDWDLALADCDQAARLDPSAIAAELLRGQVLLAAGNYELATASLDRYLSKKPDDPRALVARARALARLGHLSKAVHDYSLAVELTPHPQPEYYLERAQVLFDDGRADDSAKAIDEGIAKLGPLVVLQLYVVDLRLHQKRYDDALARLDLIIASSPRKESWLARRGEILLQAGRRKEAGEAYAGALKALNSLPPARRSNRAMENLEKTVRTGLEQAAGTVSGDLRP